MASVALDGTPLVLDRPTDRAFKDAGRPSLVRTIQRSHRPEEQQEMAKMRLYWPPCGWPGPSSRRGAGHLSCAVNGAALA